MKRYQIIYADPPLDYGNTKNPKTTFQGLNDRHYKVMGLDDIKSLPVKSIANVNCYLFLWTTAPFMEKVFGIINAWGFKYCTVAFVWVKTKHNSREIRADGLGKYTLANAEYCLVARKGRYWRKSASVRQIVLAPKRRHSEKPEEVRDRIVELMGDLPRIELFARKRVEGWDCWGNEVESDIELRRV